MSTPSEPAAAEIRSVRIHGLRSVRPRRCRSICVTPYELRVSDSDTTDRRHRRGAVTVLAATMSGHGVPLWMERAEFQLRQRLAAGDRPTVAEARALVADCRTRRVTTWALFQPVARSIRAASPADVAFDAAAPEGIGFDRWAEYNRRFNDLLMRGGTSDVPVPIGS
jgi:hypothetical protein